MISRTSVVVPMGALVAATALVAACAANSGTASFGGGYNLPATDANSGVPDIAVGDTGSAATGPSAVEGNPLCNATHYSGRCYPDDPTTAQACGIAPDGSADYDLDAGYGNAAVACHVVPLADAEAGVGPVCKPAGTGGDGASCHDSTDCAPSFECVGSGVCRQYCCYSGCDTTQFCDIQPETAQENGIPVPVCVPIRPCTLLVDPSDASAVESGDADAGDAGALPAGSCAADETCAVVTTVSAVPLTSCVQNGGAGVGASCDSDHCSAGLMCIGTSGNRHCYQLCHTLDASSECPSTQSCTGGLPLFTDPMTGVCKTPISQDL